MSTPSLSFANFDQRARAGERLNVVFFGGSLTWGAQATDPQLTSYRALMGRKFEQRYPDAHFRFWDAAIGGTGSELGSFRLERDVFARNPDLVFLDFTINDDPYAEPDADRLSAYESLVRRMVQRGIPVGQAIFAAKKDVNSEPPARPLDEKHREIAQAYGLPSGDAVTLMRKRVRSGDADPDVLWPMAPDETHPGDEGYALYAEAVWNAYVKAVEEEVVCELPETGLHAETYFSINRQKLSAFSTLPSGWTVGRPHRSAAAFDFVMSRWLDDVTVARAEAQPLRFKVRGGNVFLFGEATARSGSYEVRIDGGSPVTYEAGRSAKDGNLRYFECIARQLDHAAEYDVEILPRLEADQELRFESICVAGGPAQVEVYQ